MIASEVQVAIADSDSSFRHRLSELLEANNGFRVVAEAGSGKEAIEIVRAQEPDVLFLCMHLGDIHGLDLLRQLSPIRDTHPIVLVEDFDISEMTQALLLGACGAVQKTARPPVLFKCLRAVLSGELWFRRDVTKALLQYVERGEEARSSGSVLSDRLTPRENDVLKAIANGMPNRDIATKLGISEYTVKHHLSRIFAKLSVSNRVELALLASRYEL